MANEYSIDLSQDIPNQLSAFAEQQRRELFPRNDYVPNANEYSAVNKDALADGDKLGRGTGVFLDVFNAGAGTIDDITERKLNIKINKFNSNATYPNFPR